VIRTGTEECDDGGDNSDSEADACRTTCVEASCGDGVVDTGETCDDGNTDDGDGCSASCLLESDNTDDADEEEITTSSGGGCSLIPR
jgi:cysteine-rich repeat protein